MSEVGACTSGNGGIAAVLLDLDGVITHTAALHARAWKQAFDPFLERHGHEGRGARTPFEERDYRRYVDGKPRYDGAQAFLASRGLTLALGSPSDAPGADTVCGLANQKNRLFQDLLAESEVPVFEDALAAIQRWKAAGLRIGVVSSSRNSRAIVASRSTCVLTYGKLRYGTSSYVERAAGSAGAFAGSEVMGNVSPLEARSSTSKPSYRHYTSSGTARQHGSAWKETESPAKSLVFTRTANCVLEDVRPRAVPFWPARPCRAAPRHAAILAAAQALPPDGRRLEP